MRRPRDRRTFRFTREGKVFLLVTVGVGLAAVNTGNNLLYLMLGLMLSLLLVSGILSEIALRRVVVRRRLPERAFARTTCLVEISLTNEKKRVPSYSLEVEDRTATEPTERRCYFLKVAPSAEQAASYRRTPSRRGILRLRGFRLGTRYPFGLIEKSRLVEDEADLLVYPRVVAAPAAELRRVLEGTETPVGRPGPGTEVAGLRDYKPGDEARVVHWRRSASLGRLVVRERERDAARRLTLVLDNARPATADASWDEGFERAIERAASLAAAALSRGAAVEVVTRTGASPLLLPGAPPDPVWRFLALLDSVDEAAAPPLDVRRARGTVLHVDGATIAGAA